MRKQKLKQHPSAPMFPTNCHMFAFLFASTSNLASLFLISCCVMWSCCLLIKISTSGWIGTTYGTIICKWYHMVDFGQDFFICSHIIVHMISYFTYVFFISFSYPCLIPLEGSQGRACNRSRVSSALCSSASAARTAPVTCRFGELWQQFEVWWFNHKLFDF